MTATREEIAVPDSTAPTISLLRDLRRGHAKKQAASIAYWIYLTLFIVAVYGGSLIVAGFRALRHPPPPTAITQPVLHAAPAGLTALALLVLLALLRDAMWRGPVTVPQVTVDWLIGTPVDRGRLLRPRFRMSALLAIMIGAAAGIVPAAALVESGLGGRATGEVLRLTGAAAGSAALLFAVATGAAGLVERYRASWRWLRTATPAALAVAAAFGGLAAWAALGRPPSLLVTGTLWSGPWGWAAQAMTAMAGGRAPGWPVATALLAALALATLAAAQHAAAGVPAAALRIRAAAIGAMSAAALSMNTRGIANAYSAAGRPRRARLRLRPPRDRHLVLLWRDLLAVIRTPARLAAAVAVALLGLGLALLADHGLAGHGLAGHGLAGHGRQTSLVPVACALALGYLAAAWLCEGARLDAEDPRRSVHLPLRFEALARWHAAVPCLILLVVAGLPAAAVSVAAGDPWLVVMVVVTVPVLVAGALVNAYRADLSPEMFAGFDTPLGNTAAINIVVACALGPVLAVAPMAVLLSSAIGSPGSGALARTVVIGAGLAAGLGEYAARRAKRMRAA